MPLDDLDNDGEDLPEPEARGEREETKRDDELSDREELREDLLKLYEEVEKGFESQRTRTDEIMDYWEAYNCIWDTGSITMAQARCTCRSSVPRSTCARPGSSTRCSRRTGSTSSA